MPGNKIVINDSEELTWYVGDSKMDELIEFLHEVGFQEKPRKSLDEIKCNCEEYPESMSQILEAQRYLFRKTGIEYSGKKIAFCPWCGRHLTDQSSGQQIKTGNTKYTFI